MTEFEWRDDVEAWLAPMNYEQFWREIKPYCLVLEHREVCDAQIASGMVDQATVLDGLKILSVFLLCRRHKLIRKPPPPMLRVIEGGQA